MDWGGTVSGSPGRRSTHPAPYHVREKRPHGDAGWGVTTDARAGGSDGADEQLAEVGDDKEAGKRHAGDDEKEQVRRNQAARYDVLADALIICL